MHLYLPVALTSINILVPVGLGLAVGLLSGLFGVGGGFLMTPLLIMFGIPSTVAAATDSNQIVAASTSGTYAHWKVGNVDFKMGIYLLVGGFTGGLVGVQGMKILKAMGNADFVIKMTYVLMLGIVGAYMLYESLSSMKKAKGEHVEKPAGEWNTLEIEMRGPRTIVRLNGVMVTDYDGTSPVPPKNGQYEPDRGPRPNEGYIAIQHHGGKPMLWFKEVSLLR